MRIIQLGAIDTFVEALDLDALGFQSQPAATGRPGYHPATMLKLYIYGYRAPCARRGGNGIICYPKTC